MEKPPQKAAYPYHYHVRNDEVFYIISGRGVIETPDGKKDIVAGDMIVYPAGENGAHKIINTSENHKLVYLDCDTTNSPDIVYYKDSEKVGIIFNDKEDTFYKKNTNVDYYEGE